MERFLFNNVGKINLLNFSGATRCTYLLSLRMGIYGKIFWHLTDWTFLKNLSLSKKKELLLKQPAPDIEEEVKLNIDILVSLQKVKHLTPDQLTLKNVTDSILKVLEDEYTDYWMEKMQISILQFYQKLVHEDQNMLLSGLDGDIPDKAFYHLSVSWLVDLRSKEGSFGPDIIWLDSDFLNRNMNLMWNGKQNCNI